MNKVSVNISIIPSFVAYIFWSSTIICAMMIPMSLYALIPFVAFFALSIMHELGIANETKKLCSTIISHLESSDADDSVCVDQCDRDADGEPYYIECVIPGESDCRDLDCAECVCSEIVAGEIDLKKAEQDRRHIITQDE